MVYSILQTTSNNLVNTPKPNKTPLALNNNTTKQTTKNKIGHIMEGGKNRSNNNVNVLFTKSSSYCNEKCPRCGLDICICRCS